MHCECVAERPSPLLTCESHQSRFWFNYRVRTAYGFAIDDKLTSVTKHMANTLAMSVDANNSSQLAD